MWYRIFLFIFTFMFMFMFMFIGCSNKMLLTEHNNMKLGISTTKDMVSDLVNINVSFENNTTNDFYFLNKRMVDFSQEKISMWNFKVFFQDTIPMTTSTLINYGRVSEKDYVLFKSGEKYTFELSIDLETLTREDLSKLGNVNADYGEYSLKLIYSDPFLVKKKAFKGRIESNVIKVIYQKQGNDSLAGAGL